ncbi:hypothetical protein KFL_000050090 [Klebsormidium nitens]|uniref:Transcription elongation factor 1 homolog n=1 Tax=Klebsormidium nitens TaxID=105231 RepID=A0A1Y1HJX4_KLENI|nr:hypothetical protein KFL_000050090 [Klebsormidium nitens]|eukprot:GAQ77872.1 hypothetical protein KFL_000050090 [Klebsormidium nitens]
MGKRSSAKPPPKAVQPKVPTTFRCPFCNHDQSVDCRLDKKSGTGELRCRICDEHYRVRINNLTEPIDIYAEWIDELEKVNDPNYAGEVQQEEEAYDSDR